MLKSVEIKNFRSCYDTKFDLNGSLCAISGRNGVGKSNILKAIEWASESVIVADSMRVAPAGNTSEDLDETSIKFGIELEGSYFEYFVGVPRLSRRGGESPSRVQGLQESLIVGSPGGSHETIYKRSGEHILFGSKAEQIRIPPSTPALAALFSLLPPEDPSCTPIKQLISYFSGLRYYSLDDKPDARNYVNEQTYNEWKFRFETEGELTPSLAMRLIYMSQEDPDLFEELHHILGPQGLGVINRISIVPIDRSAEPGELAKAGGTATKLYFPLISPSAHMGGAGKYYSFSELSVGTRRVVRIVASMLFDKRSLMMMEQPEDSIHPGLLRNLIDQIQTYSCETQMVFTTHSPAVLDMLRPEEFLLATAVRGRTNVRRLTPSEISGAKEFLSNEGTFSEFLEPIQTSESWDEF